MAVGDYLKSGASAIRGNGLTLLGGSIFLPWDAITSAKWEGDGGRVLTVWLKRPCR